MTLVEIVLSVVAVTCLGTGIVGGVVLAWLAWRTHRAETLGRRPILRPHTALDVWEVRR